MYKVNMLEILALSLLMSGCGTTPQPRRMQQEPQQEEMMVEQEMMVVPDENVIKGSNFREVTSMAAFDRVLAENKIVVADFYAPWCGPCKVFGPIFEQAPAQFANIMFVKIDAEQAKELASRENVRSYPTIKAYKNGKAFKSFNGGREGKRDKPSFYEFLNSL